MPTLRLVYLVVGLISVSSAEQALKIVKEYGESGFKGNFLYGRKGDSFKIACVAPVDLSPEDHSKLVWLEKGRSVCDEEKCEIVRHFERYKQTARTIEWKAKGDTVLTCAYKSEPEQWKNVSVQIFVDPRMASTFELNETATGLQSLRLACDLPANSGDKIEWIHDGHPIHRSARMNVMTNNGTLFFTETSLVDSGVYYCRSSEVKARRGSIIIVKGKAHIAQRDVRGINRLQGDSLQINCDVYGYPLPNVTWKRNGEDWTNASDRVLFDSYNGVPNASLKISDLRFVDGAVYSCIATNSYGVENATYVVRVKERLSALWPLLGIMIEVVVLVTVILMCERRTSRMEQFENIEDRRKKTFNEENNEKEAQPQKT
ncbi:unnamed protein product [Soboliphyme baturini]|uniref:Basigin n=1 Tax=Soboliphyme baturini TaxID=241478 RepID=A0A183J9I9_9BILA|nr:unnamed protein product [Soboliphyme baturini]